MLTGIFLKIVYSIVLWILSFLPLFPSVSLETLQSIYSYLDLIIVNGMSLFYFFVRPTTFKICLDVVAFVFIAEPTYKFIMWLLRKIPFLSIE